ncbi:glycosyltransferase [Pseudonocardia parietis]|uniref:Galactofuranosylgalactofuranosylrhamnosyl-N-acetylglucosaminyl-diphospho-decaprenol beta-1,5/1,6-galactofuranosyltransferase n=1 Tax=Pseudonocardia parietis TaxID=570936 RepID=A0ABS4VM28_9PSEU|nr:glycosyltransferase [Pseudonocardia parietis]MBP2364644.1 galactofuranosylgalactofuranosylrhamnosyl-N-acetylglucosaminyl-diphospho-decaprenol beta-1,5/1,6-galactofuranosyltransferase [Pseudonocardia parietis]
MLDTARATRDGDPAPSASSGGDPRPGRLVVQRGPFTGPTPLVPEDLYAEVVHGAARRERDRIELSPATLVSTNTYWGRLHATYWQRWTAVPEVRVTLRAGGRGRIRLMASDTNKVARAVGVADVDGDTSVELTGVIDRFLDGGGLWLEFGTDTGAMTVSDVEWAVDVPHPARPTAITICTYNRVEDCLNTLQALLDDPVALGRVGPVRVVDQGSDPLESRDRFTTVADAFGEQLVYQRQPNLGGAGGFTRGLYEATAGEPADDHDVLLMDDDVLLDPEIVVRLTGFAACTAHPTIVGGQMLNLLHPGHVHITAEYAEPERLRVGRPVPGALEEGFLLGRDERLLPIVQERRVDTEYNGWWSCLIPAPIVRAIGYPLPLFFQWDDVEFGYRAREHGFPTVSLPGAGVWHADFGWKDWDEWHRYFNQRNGLITAALRTGFDRRTVTGTVVELLAQYLVAMQYGLAATLLTAVDDFLEGPAILDDGSATAAARIRAIRAAYPETTAVPITEAGLDPRESVVHLAGYKPSKMIRTWVKRAVLQASGRVPFRSGMVPAGEAHWWHVALFERAIVTDMAETGVRIRTRDRERLRELATRGVRTVRRLYTEGPEAARAWKSAEPRLTARETWTRLFDGS